MLAQIKNMLGFGPKTDYKALMKAGAIIIDVRTSAEFRQGHIKGSVNIPLQELSARSARLKKDVPLITCCASGMRSASAKGTLRALGFKEVYNGGGWNSLSHKL